MKKGQKIEAVAILEIECIPEEGLACAIVRCRDYDDYCALPDALRIDGATYGLTGWNSDRGHAYYRTDCCLGFSVEGSLS